MSLTVKAINNDTSFLLIFSPPIAPADSTGNFPGSFTILIDPWISGAAQIYSPKISHVERRHPACITSLEDLPEPDVILISQDKPDHCNEETLCQLSPHTGSTILGTPAAAKKIRNWRHFDFSCIQALQKFNEHRDETVYRIEIPPLGSMGSPGEVTISLIPAKRDITGLHNAIGITYRPPFSVLSQTSTSYINLPPTPTTPNAAFSPRMISAQARTIFPSPFNTHEKTLSVVYSPHGVSYDIIRSWASSHLVNEAALPLTALIHSFDVVQNPWFFGGNISSGCPGGLEIAKSLLPKVWIGAHDEDKDSRGMTVKKTKTKKFSVDDIKKMLWGEVDAKNPRLGAHTDVVSLVSGEEFKVAAS